MNDAQNQLLRLCGQPPARLLAEQVAVLLNCQPADVRILVAARLLKPLGNPPANSVKYFATLELQEQVKDRAWLAKVTNTLNQHWQNKNAAKKIGLAVSGENRHIASVGLLLAESGRRTLNP